MAIRKLKQGNMKVGASAVGDHLQHAYFELSAAEVMAMNGAAVAVLDAPGANKVIVVKDVVLMHNAGSAAFASGGNITLNYAGGAAVTGNVANTLLNTSAVDRVAVAALAGVEAALSAVANKGITITNATGAFTTGNGSLRGRISFTVVDLADSGVY